MRLIILYRKIITWLFFKPGRIILICRNSLYVNEYGIVLHHSLYDQYLYVRIISPAYATKLIHKEISIEPEYVRLI